jgi:two-component system cell cycle response regulator
MSRPDSSSVSFQAPPRIILVDPNDESREVMARRLTAQGYLVDATPDPAAGAEMALAAPPSALIAELWMPSISGVQLCRLLRTEPATAEVPVILRGRTDDPRSKFWAERAGASAYVPNGRMAEMLRVLQKLAHSAPSEGAFFMQLSGGSFDIRDRIARHLDDALFESVIAAEVRALASQGSFERLFDAFAQFLSQVLDYRWLAVRTVKPVQFALHHHPHGAADCERDARAALRVAADVPVLRIADEDAREEAPGEPPIVHLILFGGMVIGHIALAPSAKAETDTATLVALVARELGGPLRIAALMEESQRLATEDSLTGLMNRRAFLAQMEIEVARCQRYKLPLSFMLIDVDHFKAVNDTYGHAAGDKALSTIGMVLKREMRVPDLEARWGGEELVVALTNTDLRGAAVVAERVRQAIQALAIDSQGTSFSVTASIGVAAFQPPETLSDLIDRADRAMYSAKKSGRNRVVLSEGVTAEAQRETSAAPAELAESTPAHH